MLQINQSNFARFLVWLNPDSDQSGVAYEVARSGLMKFFAARGCAEPEVLTDETFDRVVKQIGKIEDYQVEPIQYLIGVAKNVLHEHKRKRADAPEVSIEDLSYLPDNSPAFLISAADEEAENIAKINCRNKCLQNLRADEREKIIAYYQQKAARNLEARKKILKKYKLSDNTLKVQVFRTKNKLAKCCQDCLESRDEM